VIFPFFIERMLDLMCADVFLLPSIVGGEDVCTCCLYGRVECVLSISG
jgi:hypothetical protein